VGPDAFVSAALDRKVKDLIVLDVRKFSSFTDFIIIMTGTSDLHVIRTAQYIQEALSAQDTRPIGVEGTAEGRWVLMDYGDVIIHIFLEAVRLFYDLEGLWHDVPRTRYNEDGLVVGGETAPRRLPQPDGG
jgi:ribosome-associated protein